MAAGALDFCLFPVTMKKGRPGFVLKVLAAPDQAERIENAIFAELPTLGVRKQLLERSILERELLECETEMGTLKAKKIFEADGGERVAVEFDEKIRLAGEKSVPLRKLQIP